MADQGDEDGNLIDMAFAKKRVDERKDWLKVSPRARTSIQGGGVGRGEGYMGGHVNHHHHHHHHHHGHEPDPGTVQHPSGIGPLDAMLCNTGDAHMAHDCTQVESMTYDAFINQELILFSMADNLRSIPSIMDGLKPAQRKVAATHPHNTAAFPIPHQVKPDTSLAYVSLSVPHVLFSCFKRTVT